MELDKRLDERYYCSVKDIYLTVEEAEYDCPCCERWNCRSPKNLIKGGLCSVVYLAGDGSEY